MKNNLALLLQEQYESLLGIQHIQMNILGLLLGVAIVGLIGGRR